MCIYLRLYIFLFSGSIVFSLFRARLPRFFGTKVGKFLKLGVILAMALQLASARSLVENTEILLLDLAHSLLHNNWHTCVLYISSTSMNPLFTYAIIDWKSMIFYVSSFSFLVIVFIACYSTIRHDCSLQVQKYNKNKSNATKSITCLFRFLRRVSS